MSKEIQFKEQLTFNKRADDGNHMVYFDVDPATDQLIIAGNYQAGVSTSLGGLIVDGDLFQAKGDAEVFRTLTAGDTITAPSMRVDNIASRDGSFDPQEDEIDPSLITVSGNLRIQGDLIVTGDEISNGEVLISDPIQILNTEDAGPGMTSGIGGIGVQRGTPVGKNTPGGAPGLGAFATAHMVWNESKYAWDMNFDYSLEAGDPKLYNLGYPTPADTIGDPDAIPPVPPSYVSGELNVAANVKYVNDTVELNIQNTVYLDTLQDVTIVGDLSTNRTLLFNTLTSQWEPSQFTLANLDDTQYVDPNNPTVPFGYLRWNSDQTEVKYEPTIAHTEITGLAPVAIAGTSTLPNLEDATISVLTDGEVLRTDGTVWRNAVLDFSDLSGTPTSGSYTLTGLSDTTATAVANGYLRWDATNSNVIYETTIAHTEITGLSTVAISGTATIDNLENVTIATPATAHVLQYNGTIWENAVLDFTDVGGAPENSSYTVTGLGDTTAAAVATGYLRWNATADTVMYETSIAWEQLTGLSDVAKAGEGKLDVLTDTNILTPTDKQVLIYDDISPTFNKRWVNRILAYTDLSGIPTSASYTFAGLFDTDASPLADGYLQWNDTGTSVDYVTTIPNADIDGLSTVAISGTATISNLEDTTIVTPVVAQVIRHDGTDWKNAQLSYNDLTDVPAVSSTFIGLSDTAVETIANMANKYVHWDGTGQNLVYDYASAITAGNATKLETARTISLAGDVTGSATFDGSADASITATVADNSHLHTITNVTGLDTALAGKLPVGGTAVNSDFLDGINSTQFLRSDIDSSLTASIIVPDGSRDEGMYGTYDPLKTQHIWSMGDIYRSSPTGADFGTLYGLAYKHTNNTTGGTMASGHQIVMCQNGVGSASLGTNIWTSGNLLAYSDIRVKTNIEIIPDALDKINQLHGYTFDRTDIDIDRQTGVIAQEIQEVLPEAVVGSNDENDHLSVSHGNLAGLFIEGIRALDAKNVALEAENKSLHDKLDNIMARLESLEKK